MPVHPVVANCIGRGVKMGDAVELDHKLGGGAVEIRDVRTQGNLPAEFQSVRLMLAQHLPEFSSCSCWIVTHLTRVRQWTEGRAEPPPPNPLPQGEGGLAALFCSSFPSAFTLFLQLVDEPGNHIKPLFPERGIGGVQPERRQQFLVPLGPAGPQHVQILRLEAGMA